MTCVDVMYQPYTPYFPYQRPGPSVVGSLDHLKKYGAPRLDNVASYLCSSPSITATATATATAIATVTKVESEEEEASHSPAAPSPPPIHTKYLSSNCAVLTYFNGDSSTAVDEHFTRALSPRPATSGSVYVTSGVMATGDRTAMKTAWKGSSPMTQRNFPPSFWNSAYQPPSAPLTSSGFPGMSRQDLNPFAVASDPYNHMASSLHMSAAASMHQDPWRGYPLTSQSAYPHHSELTYPGLTHARFSQHYSSLLPTTATRLGSLTGQCGADPSLVKHSDSWTGRYHAAAAAAAAADSLGSMAAAHHDSHLHSAAYTAATGVPGQESSKDMYWF